MLTLLQAYGPTECTVICSVNNCRFTGITDTNCIGTKLRGVSCYVLDDHRNLLPRGCPGELYLGGLQLSPGYHRRPELNARCFTDNPFASDDDRRIGENTRLYATGDIVRQDDDGNIWFIGRKDFQVKIRGFRVELREIEHALLGHDDVQQCMVMVRELSDSDQLAAYVITRRHGLTAGELRRYLKALLPHYMIPAYWYVSTSLPLNNSGKIDRKKLAELEMQTVESEGSEELRVKSEEFAAAIPSSAPTGTPAANSSLSPQP